MSMVLIPERKLIYIHIPCTSGTALTLALLESCINAKAWDTHKTALEAKLWFPTHATFTIIRDPWKTTESLWRRRVHIGTCPEEYVGWQPFFLTYCRELLSRTFEDFVNELCSNEIPFGYFRRWCDDYTTVFRYEDNPYEAIGFLIGQSLNVTFANVNTVERPAWTQTAINKVRMHCLEDIGRFNYTVPSLEDLSGGQHAVPAV